MKIKVRKRERERERRKTDKNYNVRRTLFLANISTMIYFPFIFAINFAMRMIDKIIYDLIQ